MADRTVTTSKLVLRLSDGVDAKHKDVTYTRIVESATDDALQAVGQALAGLQGKDLLHVIRIDEVSLS
jgi:hypothetical protein